MHCLHLLNRCVHIIMIHGSWSFNFHTPVGTKTFFLRKKIEGRDERIVLGRYPDLTLENARKLATQRKVKCCWQNPQAEKRAVRDEMTFEELFELYWSDSAGNINAPGNMTSVR